MLLITGGTLGDEINFELIAQADITSGSLGIIRKLASGAYGVQGGLTFGKTGSNVYFKDGEVSIIYEERNTTLTNFNLFHLSPNIQEFELINSNIIIPESNNGRLFTESSNIVFTGVNFSNFTTVNLNNFGSITNCKFQNCNTVILGNLLASPVTGSTFSGYTGATGAMSLTLSNTVTNCTFSNNTNGVNAAGILITQQGTYEFIGLKFSGNDFDVYNNSGGLVTINVSGGGDTPTIRNGTSASTIVNANVLITLTGLQANSEVRVYTDNLGNNDTEVAGVENSGTSFSFSISGNTVINIMINHLNYLPADIWQLNSGTTDVTIPISQFTDRQYAAGGS